MKMVVKLDEIRTAAERVAASHGLDVVDLEFIGPARERTLRVYLEKNAEGRAQLKESLAKGQGEEGPTSLREGRLTVEQLSGVTHEDCAAFSRDFGVLLDVEDLVPGANYTLEASSPGLDRKLSRPEDFDRFAGCLVKVRTFEPIRNNRHWQGRLMPGAGPAEETGKITVDLAAVKQNRKTRRAGTPKDRSSSTGSKQADVNRVDIALGNIERAELVPEI
jgi:ribosome maturation factor RimP